jgi:hypothetical protein
LKLRLTSLTFVLAALGCATEAPEQVQAPEVTTPGKTGTSTVTGTVLFKGTPPVPVMRKVTPDCSSLRGVISPEVALSPQGGVKDAFVWVKTGLPPGVYPVPETPVVLDQKGCEYVPRIVGLRVGQPIELRNSDPVLHNVHAGTTFNVPLANQGMKMTRKFQKPEVMTSVTCDVHPWMRAYAGVVAHPYFGVTGADGGFNLPALPAGTYTIEAWHERLGRVSSELTVGDGESKTVALELSGTP